MSIILLLEVYDLMLTLAWCVRFDLKESVHKKYICVVRSLVLSSFVILQWLLVMTWKWGSTKDWRVSPCLIEQLVRCWRL